MDNRNKLKCTACGKDLELHVSFDGCDWDSVKGEGSEFCFEISLGCTDCGRIYSIGRLKDEFEFCENIKKRRPYGK